MTSQPKARLPIKFCGITRPDCLANVVRYGARAVGLNLWARSKRYIDPRAAQALIRTLTPEDRAHIEIWLVVVNPSIFDAVNWLRITGADVIQLHGDETVDQIAELRAALADAGIGSRIVKALRSDEFVFDRADRKSVV